MSTETPAKVLILGATSALARACARLWAERGEELYLVARDGEKLAAVANDLKLRFPLARLHTRVQELEDHEAHAGLIATARQNMKGLSRVFVCFGVLGREAESQVSFAAARRVIEVNFLAHASLLIESARVLEGERASSLVVVTSVAGERGRGSNFVYGSSKAGLIAFVSGLRARLFSRGVHVMDVRPGLMDTPMTDGFNKKGPLWSSPERAARSLDRGLRRRADVVYAPGFWCFVMLVIRCLPERIFKRLKF
jgi:decaprenylphospho-beta-D-erythro-pentofuranosid-2-ulose 2-reductase